MNSNKSIISVENLSRKFGKFIAVNSITFDVKESEIFGFLGANGAGKTTVIRMLTGLLVPTNGKANVAGFDVYTEREKIKLKIGYMSQKFSLYEDLTVFENLRFYGGIYGLKSDEINERSHEHLTKLKMGNYRNRLIRTLPPGWKQKLAFTAAIIHNPKIVFLDEPTGGVDPITRRQFWDMIYESSQMGKTIFVTTHYLDEAEYCSRVSIMADGKIEGLGTPQQLKEQFECSSIQDVFIRIARPQWFNNKIKFS